LSTRRLPFSGTIEVTHRCNNKCIHCCNNLPAGDDIARKKELNLDEYCRILDQIAAAGCLWILFTGGEIFVRRDFFDIYAYAKSKGFLITLFTNATLITPQIADYLHQWPPYSIEITLYGSTQQTYEAVSCLPGSFERCLGGIQLLLEKQLPVKLKTVVMEPNKHEFKAIKQFVEDDLKQKFRFDAMLTPRCDCSQSPLAVRLSAAEVVGLDLAVPERVAAWKEFDQCFNRQPPDCDGEIPLYQCGAGHCSFSIDPYGRLRPCTTSPSQYYDLRTGSFDQGWNEFLNNQRQKKTTRETKCSYCGIKPMCGLCPANCELENGDAEAPVDFLCQVAHLRAYAFGIPVQPHGDCEYCEGGRQYSELVRVGDALKR
jgi:radical SAM protein with 4Fe4S-binding SPASM domain